MSARRSVTRYALYALLATIAATVAVALLGLANGLDERMLVSCVAVGMSCMFAMLGGWAWERGQWHAVLKVVAVVGAIDLAAIIALIWSGPLLNSNAGELIARAVAAVSIILAWNVISAAAFGFRFRIWWWHTVPWLGVVLLGLSAGVAVSSLAYPAFMRGLDRQLGEDVTIGVVGGLVVVSVAALLALPVMARLSRLPDDELDASLSSMHVSVAVRCPRCAAPAEVAANSLARCPACALQMRVEVQEPRCGCGYLLHRLSTPLCPECGAAVPKDLMWSAALAVTPGQRREPA